MASAAAKTMREEAICPICLDLMTEPVMIDCGHFYCHSCILENLEIQQQESPSQRNFRCSVCRAQFQREGIQPSRLLGNIIDTIKKMEQENLCEDHGEKLSLFCEDDDQLICWRCERTPQHRGHTTVLFADAYQDYKENFQESLKYLRKLEDQNKKWQGDLREKITKFQSDILSKRNYIEYNFKILHMILHMEEKSYLWRLENEEEQVLKRLQDSEAQLEKQSQELNEHIQELERKCQGSAEELLQDGGRTARPSILVQICCQHLSESVSRDVHELSCEDLCDKHVYCDLFRINEVTECKRVSQYETAPNFPPNSSQDVTDTLHRILAISINAPEDVSLDIQVMPDVDSIFCQLLTLFETDKVKVTLDPDTAHNDLQVDEDENTVIGGSPQEKQDTQARFKDLPCVLGCEAFTSGKYYFEIYFVGESDWDVGVCLENVPRDNFMIREPETGFWAIRHCENNDNVALTSPITPLSLDNVTYIGVFLDYEVGLISFYNVETGSHIFTFPKASFPEPIRPYFCIGKETYLNPRD
ncbi:E3 ubiquitin-protein ligase TRIM38-like [Sorex fumeus]|uniref:E3 ubiquitin-protein ligase TRIM38-like n=1 Tax=Sorex fumeus TaxID=62283 RepID=UPI0024ACC3AC|nr:E3 ubiquitin-protein ligase TRIM38-like [Sorex fumeus]